MLKVLTKKTGNIKGFTLIELIVVMAIIAILMVLAIPRLIGYTEAAKETADEQLAALYRNTFLVLVNSGKMAPPSGTDTFTIRVNQAGEISSVDETNLTFRDANGNYTADGMTLEDIQTDYISRGGRGTNLAPPAFTSKMYANGITITISANGSVDVAVASASE